MFIYKGKGCIQFIVLEVENINIMVIVVFMVGEGFRVEGIRRYQKKKERKRE